MLTSVARRLSHPATGTTDLPKVAPIPLEQLDTSPTRTGTSLRDVLSFFEPGVNPP